MQSDLRNRGAGFVQPLVGNFLGVHKLGGHRLRVMRLQPSQKPDFAQHRHHRVGQRIVQISSDFQSLTHDGGVAGLVCKPLHLTRSDGNTPLQFAALLLQIAQDLGKRAPELGHLIKSTGRLELTGLLTH